MNPTIVIRSETEADVRAISEVTVAASRTLEISNHTEQATLYSAPDACRWASEQVGE